MASPNFQAALQKGVTFEDEVAFAFLLEHFPEYWLEDCHNHQMTHTGYRGPSAQNKNLGNLILPDYRLTHIQSGTVLWVDAKSKKKPFTLSGHYPKLFFTIDPKKYSEYVDTINALGGKLFILIGCEKDRQLYMFDFTKVDVWHTFNNPYDNYGKDGASPCYCVDNMSVVGSF